jgi:hypothetical protein
VLERHGWRMFNWIKGQQPEGMKKIPVPNIDQKYKAYFNRLLEEYKNAEPNSLAHRYLAVLLNLISIEAIDPRWHGPKFVDMQLPNLIDDDFFKDRNSYVRVLIFDSNAQDSVRIIYGND